MGLYALCVFLGFYYAPRKVSISLVVILGLIIVGSAFIAIPVSLFVEGRNPPATAFLAMLTALLFPLLWIANVERIFYALIPGWFLQASVMAWQWFIEGVQRAGGIAENENAGSAFLLLGALFLLNHPRLKWLAVPMLLAIPFSGSRWVAIVGVGLIGMLFISHRINWKWMLVGITVGFFALFSVQYSQIQNAYRVSTTVKTTMERNGHDIQSRLEAHGLYFPIMIFPLGWIDSPLHNVPLRMSVETGLISGLAWLGVGIIVLYRRPRYSWAWWGMAAICLLSVMYYHTWIGPLGAFWWLLAAQLMSESSKKGEAPET